MLFGGGLNYLVAYTSCMWIYLGGAHDSSAFASQLIIIPSLLLPCLSLRVVFTSCIMHEVKMKCLCRFSLAATCAAVISMNWPSAHSVGQDPLKFMNNQPPPTPNTYSPSIRLCSLRRDNFSINTGPNCNLSTHSTAPVSRRALAVFFADGRRFANPPNPLHPLNPVHFACVIEIISDAVTWVLSPSRETQCAQLIIIQQQLRVQIFHGRN
jgi:hypothetical protein